MNVLKKLIILVLVMFFPVVEAGNLVSKDLELAIKAYQAKNYGQALSLFKRLPSSQAEQPVAHYYLGLTYQALHQYERAQEQFLWNYRRGKDRDLAYKSWQALEGMKNIKNNTRAATSITNNLVETAPPAATNKGGWTSEPYVGNRDNVIDPGWTWQRTSAGCGRR
ncbi:MAG: hypothetical protein K2W82_02115 [Candidatus Obscuribacterales bacterium]|nr:hypothetical protein [Candidatus Obscuribacterales bacterium]